MSVARAIKGCFSGRTTSLPLVLQSQTGECGIACLAMLSAFNGHDLDMRFFRIRFPTTSRGTNLKQLVEICNELKLIARPLRFDEGCVRALQTPCILHWEMNHFVVLKKFQGRYAIIHDPAVGQRRVSQGALFQHATGIAMEVHPAINFDQIRSRQSLHLGKLVPTGGSLVANVFLILALSVLLQLVALASPLYLQFVVDSAIASNSATLLNMLATGFLLLLVFEVITRSARQLVLLWLATSLNLHMSSSLFHHMLRLPVSFFRERHLGDIVSRFGSLGAVRNAITEGIAGAMVDGLLSVASLLAMAFYSPVLCFAVAIATAVHVLARLATYPVNRRLAEATVRHDAAAQTSMMESARATTTLKLLQLEQVRLQHWLKRIADSLSEQAKSRRLEIKLEALDTALFGILHIVVVYLAAQSVLDGVMSIGMLYAFLSYSQRFIQSSRQFTEHCLDFRLLSMHMDRIADIALSRTEQTNPTLDSSPSPASHSCPELEVECLAFKHPGASKPIFDKVSFAVSKGDTLAITGPSGCGKTTLLMCLMGLIEPGSGNLHWRGAPVMGNAAYRKAIACVLQEDQLLAGSLAENICGYDELPDFDHIVRVAKQACIHDDIMRLPMQYQTLAGDMGSNLSGGQKQRICIARALYQNPEILFMDEATSHLDSECEAAVAENLKRLALTRIVIAHREKTLQMADHVFRLEHSPTLITPVSNRG